MIKIGVVGLPGSGKTSLAKYISKTYDDIGYISVDKITTGNVELHNMRDNILYAGYNNQLDNVKELQITFRNKLEEAVKNKINEMEKVYKYVLIDYSVLYTLPEIWNNLDYRILLSRDIELRKEGLLGREGKNNLRILDKFVDTSCLPDDSIESDCIIKNNNSLDNLYSEADRLISGIKSYKEPTKHYSYYIVKPDGISYFKEIYAKITDEFPNSRITFYKIDDYINLMTRIYYKLYRKYPNTFETVFDSFKTSINGFFGNEAVLILISETHNNELEYRNFRKRILDTKLYLRSTLMNPDIRMASKLPDTSDLSGENVVLINGEKYRINIYKSLSRLHCPEISIDDNINELRLIIESGIIDNANLLGVEDISNLLKFESIKGFNHDSKELRPDIATYDAFEISKSLIKL